MSIHRCCLPLILPRDAEGKFDVNAPSFRRGCRCAAVPLVVDDDDDHVNTSAVAGSVVVKTTADELERALLRRLNRRRSRRVSSSDNEEEEEECSRQEEDDGSDCGVDEGEAVSIYVSDDAHLLRCRRRRTAFAEREDDADLADGGDGSGDVDGVIEEDPPANTITGIAEHRSLFERQDDDDDDDASFFRMKRQDNGGGDGATTEVTVTWLRFSMHRLRDAVDDDAGKADDERATMTTTTDLAGRGCPCDHPRYDWGTIRRRFHQRRERGGGKRGGDENGADHNDDDDMPTADGGGDEEEGGLLLSRAATAGAASLTVVDLTSLQDDRRRRRRHRRRRADLRGPSSSPCDDDSTSSVDDAFCSLARLDSPGDVTHLLRSVLSCRNNQCINAANIVGSGEETQDDNGGGGKGLHCASPWFHETDGQEDRRCRHRRCIHDVDDPVVALLLRDPSTSAYHRPSSSSSDDENHDNGEGETQEEGDEEELRWWDDLERSELHEFLKFRTGDAAPSYYLHSSARLRDDASTTVTSRTAGRHRLIPNGQREDEICSASASVAGGSCGVWASVAKELLRGSDDDDDSYNDEYGMDGGEEVDDDGGYHRHRGAALLVYRHLPPRDFLTRRLPRGRATAPSSASDHGRTKKNESSNFDRGGRFEEDGCLWEAYVPPPPPPEQQHENGFAHVAVVPPPTPVDVVRYRRVAPPYLSHEIEYPGLLDEMLMPCNLAAIRDEARRIPQWTAWPETNHYSSEGGDGDGDEEGEGGSQPSWTVFPLCHTFPADVVANRKFLSTTTAFVPQTTALLRKLGPALRTALFSRLAPRTTLGAHTGWEDLANHVLRVHVPLIVPSSSSSSYYGEEEGSDEMNGGGGGGCGSGDFVGAGAVDGLCGTWVDGVVESHEVGRVVCFDDSKVHRAFNYGDEERIVLILDLERPPGLPKGTATGGHTEELDAFIESVG